jgi:hypothetical protein
MDAPWNNSTTGTGSPCARPHTHRLGHTHAHTPTHAQDATVFIESPAADLALLAGRAPHNTTLRDMVAACMAARAVVAERGGPEDTLPTHDGAQPAQTYDDVCDPVETDDEEDDAATVPQAASNTDIPHGGAARTRAGVHT